jgi:HEAT repeat protein
MKMNEEQKLKNIEILSNGSPEQKIDLLSTISSNELTEKLVQPIANLVSDKNKGVRNAATLLILNNPREDFAKHIVNFVSSEDIAIRNLAGEILIKLDSQAVNALIEYDHQNNDDTIKFNVDVLGQIRDPRAALFIMGIISSSENDNVILACIEAFGNIRYEGAVEVMMLFYDRNELYKPTIVEALGKIGSKEALNFLTERYPNEDELTKYSILESFGSLGDIETYFFLLEQVATVSGTLVLPLVTSISLLKERFNLDIPYDNRMKNLLMYTMSEGTAADKKIAFSLVDSFEDKEIICASLNLLGTDFELDDMIRNKVFKNADYIYHEIAKLINSNPPTLRHILNLFLATINYVNEFGVEINVSMLDLKNTVHAVSGLLDHQDEEVRRTSMEILFNLDLESALLFIDTMVNDENSWNRLRLIEILGMVPGDSFDPAIQKLAEDYDEMVRERAQYIVNLKQNQFSTNS